MAKQDQQQALQFFFSYWQDRYPKLHKTQRDWLAQHSSIHYYEKKEVLYHQGDNDRMLYIALGEGILTREKYCEHCNRNLIFNIALPHMGLFTTMHYYSDSPSLGDITVLKCGWVLRIPYKHLEAIREQEPAITMLLGLLVNKEKYQTDHLRVMESIPQTANKYFYFADHLSHLYWGLTQPDQARLLHISESSIKRAKKIYLKLK